MLSKLKSLTTAGYQGKHWPQNVSLIDEYSLGQHWELRSGATSRYKEKLKIKFLLAIVIAGNKAEV